MSIPLVQDNQKDSINASLIAIKREEERLQALIAEADKKIAQLNELKVSKSDIVDEVTLNNMQSVTSNAVAEEINKLTEKIPVTFINNKHNTDNLSGWIENNKLYIVGYTVCITAITSSNDVLFYIVTDKTLLKEALPILSTPVIGAFTAIRGQTLAIKAFTYNTQSVNDRNYINDSIPLS